MPLFQNATFFTTVANLRDLPHDTLCEVAFAGRSNAGKSSAINTLANHTRLAFVSKTPGRTQNLNYFQLAEGKYLVDLPGYGYAKAPDEVRAHAPHAPRRFFPPPDARVVLTADDLIYPVFVLDGERSQRAVASMPGVERQSLDPLLRRGRTGAELGVPALALFPVIDARGSRRPAPKKPGTRTAWCRAWCGAEEGVPELGVITDVALDPYTSHGQDGLIDADDPRGYVLNDETLEALAKQALCTRRPAPTWWRRRT
jgi:hypothetical protein